MPTFFIKMKSTTSGSWQDLLVNIFLAKEQIFGNLITPNWGYSHTYLYSFHTWTPKSPRHLSI